VLDDLQRLLSGHPADTISVGETVSHLVFEVGNVTLAVARRTISFPDVEKQLLAGALKDNSALLTVDCAELAKAVKRVRINADAQTSAIALRLSSGRLLVESRDKAGNSAEESVLASWEGKERVLVVNHGFLSEMLAAHGESLCEFRLGPDVGKRLSVLLLPGQPGCVQVLTRMPAVLLGY
jgi:DNA polymerase III sliding clamp (beta) subunit (PCNA family)